MKKICFLVPEIQNCGPVNVVFSIIENLDLDKVDVMLIAVRKTNYSTSIFKLCNLGVFYLDDYKSNLNGLKELTKDIDVVHSHGYFPDKLVSSLDMEIKKISTIHCMFFKDYPKEYGFVKGYLGAFLHLYYLNKGNFNYIVGCSDSVSKYYKGMVSSDVIVITIHNGVDQDRFCKISLSEKNKLKQMNGFKDKNIFIYSGRLIRRKKVPELIEFFKKYAIENSILLILGDGPELGQCQTIANDNVIFLGHVDSPEYYYQFSDFVLSNSSAEGYPMSIIEAVSCGCYALLSEIPPHVEFIENNPHCASLISQISLKNFDSLKFDNNVIANLSARYMAKQYLAMYLD